MGLFNLFKRVNRVGFYPNFRKDEYENLLEFINQGGTESEWERMKKANNWSFPESEVEKFERYQ